MTEGGQPPLPTKGSAGADDKARAGLTQFLDNLFRPLDQLGRVWTVVWQGFKDFLRQIMLLRVIFLLILLVSGIYHYVAKTLGVLDRALDRLETTIIFVATLGMTGLVFLDFVNRESDSFSLEIADPVKLSLLMMLWVAFLGSSLATRDGKHLAIDAADRALSPKGSRLLYRISMLLATIFSWQLFKASVAVVKKHFFNESLAKVTVPETVTRWLNSFFSWLLD
ncbi:MAG TPA: hypothetical protein DIU15_18995, partial [Deltaproteobacteria bacterium]|nr:hypothetical protein [Deltaproteobacteria bacterium]